jgi:hypothetical protein
LAVDQGDGLGLIGDSAMDSDLTGTVKLDDIYSEAAQINSTIDNHLSLRDDVNLPLVQNKNSKGMKQ